MRMHHGSKALSEASLLEVEQTATNETRQQAVENHSGARYGEPATPARHPTRLPLSFMPRDAVPRARRAKTLQALAPLLGCAQAAPLARATREAEERTNAERAPLHPQRAALLPREERRTKPALPMSKARVEHALICPHAPGAGGRASKRSILIQYARRYARRSDRARSAASVVALRASSCRRPA
jgi:hypothetical protein